MSFFSRRKNEPDDPIKAEDADDIIQSAPRPARPPASFDTVLGKGSVAEGVLQCEGNIRLDGTFSGNLQITGNVLVGESAVINADLHADNITIAGTVRGNVGGSKIQLLRTSRVWGDITATTLTTEEGAFIEGKVSMKAADPLVPPEDSDSLPGVRTLPIVPPEDEQPSFEEAATPEDVQPDDDDISDLNDVIENVDDMEENKRDD